MTQIGTSRGENSKEGEQIPPAGHRSKGWTSLCRRKRRPKSGDVLSFTWHPGVLSDFTMQRAQEDWGRAPLYKMASQEPGTELELDRAGLEA